MNIVGCLIKKRAAGVGDRKQGNSWRSKSPGPVAASPRITRPLGKAAARAVKLPPIGLRPNVRGRRKRRHVLESATPPND